MKRGTHFVMNLIACFFLPFVLGASGPSTTGDDQVVEYTDRSAFFDDLGDRVRTADWGWIPHCVIIEDRTIGSVTYRNSFWPHGRS